jgi:N6-L-threonylcarbamoyladenine synthase
MRDHLTYRLLGQTVDDAAGEAFDKVGRLLGLRYPGGPAIQRPPRRDAARRELPAGVARRVVRLLVLGPEDGGATHGRRARAGCRPARARRAAAARGRAELAWGFQDAVVDVLVTKTMRAARAAGARSIVLGGGVAANASLRERLAGEAEELGVPLIVPAAGLCTDNGAMIGAAGARALRAGERSGLDLEATPSLPLAR